MNAYFATTVTPSVTSDDSTNYDENTGFHMLLQEEVPKEIMQNETITVTKKRKSNDGNRIPTAQYVQKKDTSRKTKKACTKKVETNNKKNLPECVIHMDKKMGPYYLVKNNKQDNKEFRLYIEQPPPKVVGTLKSWEGKQPISFENCSFLAYNPDIGRVFYDGFEWNHKKFMVGDSIYISTDHVKVRKMAIIVCCYLATKTYNETLNGSKEPENVQERGFPYMGLWMDQRKLKCELSIKFNRKKIEHPPEWLQETSLKISNRGLKSLHTKDDRLKPLLNNASYFQWDNNLIITQSPDVEDEVDLEKIHESEYDSIQEESDDHDEVEARMMSRDLGENTQIFQENIQADNENDEKDSDDAYDDEQKERDDDYLKGSKFESKEYVAVTIGDEKSDIESMTTNNDDDNGPHRAVIRDEDRFCLYLNKPSKYKVGKLKQWPDINFSWIEDSFVAYNKDLGRVYYGSFSLNGHQFSMGEIAMIHTKAFGSRNAMIISCYQATKSYEYFEEKENQKLTPQDRGYPYMEIQYVDTSKKNHSLTDCDKVEFPPDWLQEKFLTIEKISHLIEFTSDKLETIHEYRLELLSRAASFQWPEEHNVDEVTPGVEEEGDDDTTETTDCDVDDFDDGQQDKKSGIQLVGNKNLRIKNLVDNMIRENNWNKDDFDKTQLVAHDKYWESKLIDPVHHMSTQELENLKEALNEMRSDSDIDNPDSETEALCSQLEVRKLSKQPLNAIAKVIPENEFQADPDRDVRIEAVRKKLGYPKLEQLFLQVINDLIKEEFNKDATIATGPKHDILLQAPCGYGKSCCFAIASQILGGITLIIEPLRALIESQVTELKGRGVCVEKLLPRKDATYEELAAEQRLEHILLARTNAIKHEPLILLMTPELFQGVKCMIQEFVRRRLISLIVVDEFDEIQNAKINYRESYLRLIQDLRHTAPNVQLFLLSATLTKKLIIGLNLSLNQMFPNKKITAMPYLYRTGSPLPSNHIYRVERKISAKQVVEDVVKEIKNEMCLCYCLTPTRCKKMKDLFEEHNVKVDCYYSDQDNKDKERVLEQFRNGALQVLCVTKALGRGVHLGECPIRFVIHATMPLSLTDYIQETGRGGRDGLPTSCIMYYRDQDKAAAKSVLNSNGQLELAQKKRLHGVCMYALEGKACRNKMLSTVAVDEACPDQYCFNRSCDNCKMKVLDEHQPVNEMIIDLIESASNMDFSADNTSRLFRPAFSLLKTYSIDNKFLMCGFLYYQDDREKTLLDYLNRLIVTGSQEIMSLQQRIESSRVSFFLRSKTTPARKLNAILPDPKAAIATNVLEVCKFKPKRVQKLDRLPYLIQFELRRLDMNNFSDFEFYNDLKRLCHQNEIAAWKLLYQKQKRVMPLQKSIAAWERSPEQMKLFFSCSLSKNGLTLKLNQPDYAFDRRIYRRYGSHRFLEISVDQDTQLDIIKKYFNNPLDFCGRRFRFLWTKLNKSPQVFILFAESGIGIHPNEECSVLKLRETCIPKSLNKDLTIAQYFKRMKLWFSTTSQGVVLENGSIDLVPDFNCHGMKEIDGAGLVSQALLERLKDEYKKNCSKNDFDFGPKLCTGFQGRIGGHKGVWNLDPSLGTENIKMLCRNSQTKYNSLFSEDPWQNTVEICSWNEKLPAKLNTRTIQILEYLASKAGKEAEYKEFCNDCMAQSINELEKLCSDESNELLKEMTRRNKRNFKNQVETDYEKNDTIMLFEMGAAGIDSTDPTFAQSKKRLIEKLFRGIIEGARYPIKDSCSLRMVPDHTLLLDEGEVFVALEDQVTPIKEVIALRSPAYFASDIRRLKVVDLDTLKRRSIERQSNPSIDVFARIPQDLQITLDEQITFFKRIRFSFVMSSFGDTNEADKMSGGDYDGDNAWICWNEKLLACLPEQSQVPLTMTDKDKVHKPPKYEICVWDATLDTLLEYSRHFCCHQWHLGQYADLLDICIDMYGFDHQWSIELGWRSFFQVDHPYNNPRGSPDSLSMKLKEALVQIPHWKQHKKPGKQVYQSKSVLGEMYSIMNDKLQTLNEVIVHEGIKLPPGIEEKLNQCELDDMKTLTELREKMTCEINAYIKERDKEFPKPFINEEMKTKFYRWQSHYCHNISLKLFTNKAFQRIGNAETAAVIYEQCRKIHAKNRKTKATEFAWAVAKSDLIKLLVADGGLHISKEKKNAVLSC